MHSAMVLQGENRGSLAIARALGKEKIEVSIGSGQTLSMSIHSKYCSRSFCYPLYRQLTTENIHQSILDHVRRWRPEVLFIINNLTSYVVLEHLEEYEKYTHVISHIGFRKFLRFSDKKKQLDESRKAGFAIPKTLKANTTGNIIQISEKLHYPVVIKPIFGAGGRGIAKANNENEFELYVKSLAEEEKTFYFDPTSIIIQEYIPGKIYTAAGIFDQGREVAVIIFENLLHISEFGQPLVNKTVENKSIREAVIRLLEKLQWHGPFNLQIVVDPKDDTPKLLDFNPRLWAPIQSAIAAGMDIPRMLFDMAIGKKPKKVETCILGQVFRFSLWWELPFLIRSKNRFQLLRYVGNAKTDIDLSDPLPHLVHLASSIKYRQLW